MIPATSSTLVSRGQRLKLPISSIMITMSELQIWITYHDDTQIKGFGLAEDDVFRLLKGYYT